MKKKVDDTSRVSQKALEKIFEPLEKEAELYIIEEAMLDQNISKSREEMDKLINDAAKHPMHPDQKKCI